jgi:glutamate/tyrosine decarboxylase-like PLP-dependent enzyme
MQPHHDSLTENYLRTLKRALHHAETYLDELDHRPVGSVVSYETLRSRLARALPEDGCDAIQVIDDLVADVDGGILGCAGGRFFAWVIGGALPSALAADWLTSTWDQNAALYACGPAAAVVEEVAGQWIKELLDLPQNASFAFTTGCQLAHFTCLAAARHAVLTRSGWNLEQDGLFGAAPLRVIVSEQRHGSVDRALRYLGFGRRHIVAAAVDENGSIDSKSFQRLLTSSATPTIVVLDAADLNIGAFDDFAHLIPMAKQADAWVHIDGAFGLIARASRTIRKMVAGVELADSWATDAHKWLNVPFDSGIAVIRDADAHKASMTVSASYITAGKARDQIDWNPEWSRRGRGFAIYAALREMGRGGLEKLVDRCCEHARSIVMSIGALPGAEVLWPPTLNQGLVRFRDSRTDATDADHDARTLEVVENVNASGEAFFSTTTWRGMKAMRVSVVNWRTSHCDVERAVAACRSAMGASGSLLDRERFTSQAGMHLL